MRLTTKLTLCFGLMAVGTAIMLYGCAAHTPLPTRAEWESYDQERLKRSDYGCPTSVYVAPDGDLIQCQLVVFGQSTLKTEVAPREFTTPELAAIDGLRVIALKPTSQYYEWGGLVAKMPNAKFVALPPSTDLSGDSVSIRSKNSTSFGLNAEVVGTYHTHPCVQEHDVEFFSPPDLQEAIYWHKLVFMGDFCTGGVHEFVPGDKPDAEPAHDRGLFLTKGRIIGAFTAPHAEVVAE
jgi:hypothetical protein